MLKLVKIAWGFVTGNRSYITLLIVAGAAAWLYAQGAIARHERDVVTGLAEQICSAAGSGLQPEGTKPKDRGKHCRSAVRRLAAFERDTNQSTADTLIAAMKERDTKSQADVSIAIRAATDARLAAQNMEKADAAVAKDDVVRGPWFDALNRSAGLRPSGH